MDGTPGRARTRFGDFLREVGDELATTQRSCVPSVSPARADWRRLSKETAPIPGESLRGLVARACRRNDLPNSWGLLQHLGQQHRNRVLVSEDPGIDPAELAFAIRVAEGEVRARRYEPSQPGRVSFFGLHINPRRLDTRVRRFSPNSLLDPRGQYHRATWELRDVPFCLEGWDMLQDRCGCERDGVIQGWTRTLTEIGECDACGDPLYALEPILVPDDLRPALSILAALVEPMDDRREDACECLPAPLRGTDRSAVFDVLVRMAAAIDPDAADRDIEEPADRLRGLHRACDALSRWPDGIDDIRWPDATLRSTIQSLRMAWVSVASPSAAECTGGPSTTSAPAATVGIRAAGEIAGLTPEVLLGAWEHGHVSRYHRIHGSRMLPAFDPAELRRLGDAWRDRVAPDALAHRLGISFHGLEQLVALGGIDADGPALPGTGPFFKRSTVERFLSAIEEGKSATIAGPISLRAAFKRISGRAKPWGPVLRELQDGGMPYTLVGAGTLADRIHVKSMDIERIVGAAFEGTDHPHRSFRDRMVQRDALEFLNLSIGGERRLRHLPVEGGNPKTYSVADIEALARSFAYATRKRSATDLHRVSTSDDEVRDR